VLHNVLRDSNGVLHYVVHYVYLCGYSEQPWFNNAFSHAGDINHVTLEFSAGFTAPVKQAYFSRHGDSTEGQWYPAHELTFSGTHLWVYLSLGDHIPYPTPGTQVRYYGIMNDLTAVGGSTWLPLQVVPAVCTTCSAANPASQAVLPSYTLNTPGFMVYNGKFGSQTGVDFFGINGWFTTYESDHAPWCWITYGTMPEFIEYIAETQGNGDGPTTDFIFAELAQEPDFQTFFEQWAADAGSASMPCNGCSLITQTFTTVTESLGLGAFTNTLAALPVCN